MTANGGATTLRFRKEMAAKAPAEEPKKDEPKAAPTDEPKKEDDKK